MAINIRYLGGLWAFIAIGLAVGRASNASPDTPQIQVQFSVFGTHALQGLAYRSAVTDKVLPLKFYSVTLSSLYDYRGEPSLRFYDAQALAAALDTIAKEKATDSRESELDLKIKPIAVCRIPDGMKRVLLLFIPRSKPGEDGIRCDVYPINMDTTKVPAGNLLIVNASGREFVGEINSRIVKIHQGVSEPYEAQGGRITVKMARLEPEKQSLVCGDRWKLAKNQRRLWILFPYANPDDIFPDNCCVLESEHSLTKDLAFSESDFP